MFPKDIRFKIFPRKQLPYPANSLDLFLKKNVFSGVTEKYFPAQEAG